MQRTLVSFGLFLCLMPMVLAQSIERVQLLKSEGGKPGRAVAGLSPKDNPFHVLATVKGVAKDTTFTGTLIAVEAAGLTNYKVVSVDMLGRAGTNSLTFRFSLPRDWPAGKYRVEVKIGGKPGRSLNFQIK